jgi:hypothetical protein
MPLSYLREDCHKQAVTHIRESRRFKSMYTLQGKTRPTRHVRFPHQSTYVWRMLPPGGPYTWQPSMSHRQSWTESLLPRKGAPDTIPNTPADRSVGPYPVSLLSQPMKQWRKSNIHQLQATRFTGLISPACDRYVQYLLMGPTERSLIDTGGGYNLGGASLPHAHSMTFPTSCLPFPLVAPPGLHFNQILAKDQGVES